MIKLNKYYTQFLFWLLVAITLVLTLMPADEMPNALNFWDKLQHSLCFTILTFVGLFAYMQKPKQLCIGLCFYGALIELMQAFFTSTRHGDWFDWMADSLGIVVGLGLFLIIRKYVRI
jgi:VanZ family protein